MAQGRNEKLITALDIGSSKVCALIAEKTESGELNVLGTGQRESRGVRRGYVADMERTEVAIREAVDRGERAFGVCALVEESAAAAQSDAQSALSQEKVPRAYQGAVRDYFDDLKTK